MRMHGGLFTPVNVVSHAPRQRDRVVNAFVCKTNSSKWSQSYEPVLDVHTSQIYLVFQKRGTVWDFINVIYNADANGIYTPTSLYKSTSP